MCLFEWADEGYSMNDGNLNHPSKEGIKEIYFGSFLVGGVGVRMG